ncbi:pseudouridine synthase, putative [Babesia ovis]|uniref:Pseudouridine synthase, putative n=1 Tax=Babesia ovis TaxID=5869 RepID=A0A9W5WVF9_BABOV|nr:pseudouridine synthase, putative [Babesia ovis]
MASLCNEIRLLLTGPENRFFVAYKPPGWFLTKPFEAELGEGVIAPVLAAKLGVDSERISFPSKLAVNERGLVIGCTDSAMHDCIHKIMQSGKCSKSYQCVIHANRSQDPGVVGRSIFKHTYECFNHRTDVSTGVVNLELKTHVKNKSLKWIQKNLDENVRHGISQFVARSRVVSAYNITAATRGTRGSASNRHKVGGDTGITHDARGVAAPTLGRQHRLGPRPGHTDNKPNGKHTFAYIMENLRSYLQRFDTGNGTDNLGCDKGLEAYCTTPLDDMTKFKNTLARFRHMEIVTSAYDINRYLTEVLSSMGLVVLTSNVHGLMAMGNKCLELCSIEFQHPIYKDRVIQARVHEGGDPVIPKEWVKHVLTCAGGET